MDVSIKSIANKCIDSVGFNVIVRAPVKLFSSADTNICQGGIANLWCYATGSDSTFTYVLKSTSSLLLNSSGAFLVSPIVNQTYFLGAINKCNSDTIWNQVKVFVSPPLHLVINSIDTTICSGGNYLISANCSGGKGTYLFQLKKNNIILQSNATGNFNVLADSSRVYTIVVSDNCTVLKDSVNIRLNVFNQISFAQPLSDIYVCENEIVHLKSFVNVNGNSLNYTWMDINGKSLGTADTLEYTPVSSQQIILKVSDRCKTIYDTAWIYHFAEINGTNINSDVSSGCIPLTVNFESPNLLFSNNQICEMTWDFNDRNTSTLDFKDTSNVLKAKHTFTSAGIYNVTLKLKFKNKTSFCYNFSEDIEALTIPYISISVSPHKITMPNTKCTAIITTKNSDSVVVDWGDGYIENFISNPSLITQEHNYSDTGHYNIKAFAFNKNTCYSEANVLVNHSDSFFCFIPNVFSPNRDNLNESFKPILSYCKSYELTIFDRWGEIVFETSYVLGKNSQNFWNGDGFSSDTYLYILNAKDGDNNRHVYKGTVMLIK